MPGDEPARLCRAIIRQDAGGHTTTIFGGLRTMARRRRKRNRNRVLPTTGVFIAVFGGVWFVWGWLAPQPAFTNGDAELGGGSDRPRLTTNRPENGPLDGGRQAAMPERGADDASLTDADAVETVVDPAQAHALLNSAKNAMDAGDAVLARSQFTEAMNLGLAGNDEEQARTQLRSLGRQMVFSAQCVEGDPLSKYHVIQPGEALQKIAAQYDVTAEFLARINGIEDMNRIRAGRRLKVVQGPFHARVNKRAHALDVFLGDTYIDHFKVGLGAEDSTPSGMWVVKNKLKNPTYYPPRGGQIVAADDPENPLGERWIGLDGVGGGAVGQMRYGIHGTIEPESIGMNASMGCVRLYNEDVELLFDLLIVDKSRVEIRDE